MDDEGAKAVRGVSRRAMLRASIGAGAAAWTAPVIIDSLTSPAGAMSPCKKYYAKYTSAGACYNAAPACSNSAVTGGNTPTSSNTSTNGGYTWVCACGNGCTTGPKFRQTFQTNAVTVGGIAYTRIVLASGCEFSSSQTTYAVVGNYNFASARNCRAVPAGAANASGPTSGSVGVYQNGGNTVWIAQVNPDATSQTLDYIYLEFCCNS